MQLRAFIDEVERRANVKVSIALDTGARPVDPLGASARGPARPAQAAFGSGRGAPVVEEGRTNPLGLVLALGRPAAIDGCKNPVLLFGLLGPAMIVRWAVRRTSAIGGPVES